MVYSLNGYTCNHVRLPSPIKERPWPLWGRVYNCVGVPTHDINHSMSELKHPQS